MPNLFMFGSRLSFSSSNLVFENFGKFSDRHLWFFLLKSDTMLFIFNFQYFTTKPYACEPSSLPKYPPSKEIDAKNREEARRLGFSFSFSLSDENFQLFLSETKILSCQLTKKKSCVGQIINGTCGQQLYT